MDEKRDLLRETLIDLTKAFELLGQTWLRITEDLRKLIVAQVDVETLARLLAQERQREKKD